MPDDAEGKFRTHCRYLEAFAQLGGFSPWDGPAKCLEVLAARWHALAPLGDVPTGAPDLDEVKNRLRHAWAAELLLGLGGVLTSEDELIRLANTWGTVQTYYVAYHTTQALRVSLGHPRPTSHPITQNLFTTYWAARSLDLAPWTLGVTHDGYRNAPGGKKINEAVHPWESCGPHNCADLAAKAISTTRRFRVDEKRAAKRQDKKKERRKAWLADEKERQAAGKPPRTEPEFPLPQLNAAEKTHASKTAGTFTMLHYLYRLRVNTNYKESDVFTDGPTDELQSSEVHSYLSYLCAATLLVHELRIADLVGARTVHAWADDWISKQGTSASTIGLSARRHLL